MIEIIESQLFIIINFHIFAIPFYKDRVAEWLGRGLQNLVQRFESASDLPFFKKKQPYLSRKIASYSVA